MLEVKCTTAFDGVLNVFGELSEFILRKLANCQIAGECAIRVCQRIEDP